LAFDGATVPRDGHFDLHRRVFVDRQSGPGGGHDGDAARLCGADGGGDVATEKQFLHRDAIRRIFVDQGGHGLVNGQETFGERCFGGGFDDAEIEHVKGVLMIREHAETGDGVPGSMPRILTCNSPLRSFGLLPHEFVERADIFLPVDVVHLHASDGDLRVVRLERQEELIDGIRPILIEIDDLAQDFAVRHVRRDARHQRLGALRQFGGVALRHLVKQRQHDFALTLHPSEIGVDFADARVRERRLPVQEVIPGRQCAKSLPAQVLGLFLAEMNGDAADRIDGVLKPRKIGRNVLRDMDAEIALNGLHQKTRPAPGVRGVQHVTRRPIRAIGGIGIVRDADVDAAHQRRQVKRLGFVVDRQKHHGVRAPVAFRIACVGADDQDRSDALVVRHGNSHAGTHVVGHIESFQIRFKRNRFPDVVVIAKTNDREHVQTHARNKREHESEDDSENRHPNVGTTSRDHVQQFIGRKKRQRMPLPSTSVEDGLRVGRTHASDARFPIRRRISGNDAVRDRTVERRLSFANDVFGVGTALFFGDDGVFDERLQLASPAFVRLGLGLGRPDTFNR
jgi:hypothetical protein